MTAPAEAVGQIVSAPHDTLLRDAARRFTRHRLAVIGAVILAIVFLIAIFAPFFLPDLYFISLTDFTLPPSAAHILGTDLSGRDVAARVATGARTSLIVGFGAVAVYVAIGLAVHHHRPSWSPRRLVRRLAIGQALRVLRAIQPSNGGFLEATPLTSFVALGLASTGRADHPVVRQCVAFIVQSVRPDGSWPIDTNLATWVTTLSINALAAAGELESLENCDAVREWLLKHEVRQ